MKKLFLVLSACLLAGCATSGPSQNDLARYGTPPSDEDLYQYMSTLRDSMPPTRYVSFRDKGYADSVKKATYTDQDGRAAAGWEYDFEVAAYDEVGTAPPQWGSHRAVFFNGRPIGMFDGNGNFVRSGAQSQAAPAPATAPATAR